jgi:peptidyl-prolyl cis-trans isomerase B (cyclophilin B)
MRLSLRQFASPAIILAFVAAPVLAAPDAPQTQTQKAQGAPKMETQAARQTATIQTSKGTITFELTPDLAPEHVKNFVELAQSGFYNGTKFHRVIPGFMVQGGDPNTKTANTSSWGMGNGPRRIKAEFSPAEKASHVRGMVSMARGGDPNSASCQFFIVQQDSKFLDAQYSIFGKVLTGLEVVDAIANTPRDSSDRPLQPVVIEKVTISGK